MRKKLVAAESEPVEAGHGGWIDLEVHGRVRLTSEDPEHPIEAALQPRAGGGWRAALPGPQTLWLDFDVPQAIREIHLRFESADHRTQEFVLQASSDGGHSYREIVRQQFNFSPAAATEDEHYFPHLSGVTELKLTIVPDISGGDARATLRTLRVR